MANNTTALGTVSLSDLSHNYAAGSFLATAEFVIDGIHFVARRFRRTDSYKVDSFELYISGRSHDTLVGGCDDFVKHIDPHASNLSRVDRRALHLLAVACSVVGDDVALRFSLIELN